VEKREQKKIKLWVWFFHPRINRELKFTPGIRQETKPKWIKNLMPVLIDIVLGVRVSFLKIFCPLQGKDAMQTALCVGTVYSVLGVFLSIIHKRTRGIARMDVEIIPVFGGERKKIFVSMVGRFTLGTIIWDAVKSGAKNLRKFEPAA